MKKVILFVSISAAFMLAAYRNSLRAQVTQVDASLPVYTATGTAIPNAHVVVGDLKASRGGDTVTLTGPAVFSGAETYICTLSIERGGPVVGTVTPIDGSHFRIDGGTSGGWKEHLSASAIDPVGCQQLGFASTDLVLRYGLQKDLDLQLK